MSDSQSMTERALIAAAQGQAQYNQVQRDRRDRFAAAALTGLLANDAWTTSDATVKQVAPAAREFADWLIAELDKP